MSFFKDKLRTYCARIAQVLLAGLLAGCTTPYGTPLAEFSGASSAKTFKGISNYAAEGDLRVVWLHGMCKHGAPWAANRNALVGGVAGSHSGAATRTPARPGSNSPYRITYEHAVNGNDMELRYLVWSPLTRSAKFRIKLDNNDNYTKATLNKQVKAKLINDCFSDAVVYSGPAGDPIRSWIKGEVCDALGGRVISSGRCTFGSAGARRSTIFVAESLGSKMLSDALLSIWNLSSAADRATLKNRLSDVQMVFLLANQIPLLNAATHPENSAARLSATEAAPTLVDVFAQARLGRSARTFAAAPDNQLRFVAFSDPNDLLSYPLFGGANLPSGVSITNVIVSNDRTYFGLIERPDTAHCGYGWNPAVLGAIVKGYDGKAFARLQADVPKKCGLGS